MPANYDINAISEAIGSDRFSVFELFRENKGIDEKNRDEDPCQQVPPSMPELLPSFEPHNDPCNGKNDHGKTGSIVHHRQGGICPSTLEST